MKINNRGNILEIEDILNPAFSKPYDKPPTPAKRSISL